MGCSPQTQSPLSLMRSDQKLLPPVKSQPCAHIPGLLPWKGDVRALRAPAQPVCQSRASSTNPALLVALNKKVLWFTSAQFSWDCSALRMLPCDCLTVSVLFIFAFHWYVLRWSRVQLHASHRAMRSFIFVIQGFQAFPVSSCACRVTGRWEQWSGPVRCCTKSLCPHRTKGPPLGMRM